MRSLQPPPPLPRYKVDSSPAAHFRLTRREAEIVLLLAEGRSTAEMAAEFGTAATTIRDHIASAQRRLSASTRGQLVGRAIEEGVLRIVHNP